MPEKLDIIRNWKAPENEEELRQFLGICTFWRRFVKDFAKIAVPLHNLLNKPQFLWTLECQQAFESMKEILCLSVTLHLPQRFGRNFQSRVMRLVMLWVTISNKLTHKAEVNYSTTEKECLAVIEALNAYRPYLLANEFDLYTDHQSLKWLLPRTKEHSGRLWRWVDKIPEFQYPVQHIAGKNIL